MLNFMDTAVLSSIRRDRSLATSPAPDSLLTDLVAWWSLDEASGTRVNAHAPGTHDLTDNNTVGSTTGVVGNAAVNVQANSEYLSLASTDALKVNNRDFTVSGWFKFATGSASQAGLIGKAAAEWVIRRDVSQQIQLVVRNAANSGDVRPTSVAITYDTWFFVLAYHDATNDVVGIEVNRGTPQTAALTGGSWTGGTNEFRVFRSSNAILDGSGDECNIWHRLLTTDEKDRLYNAGAGMTYPG